MTLISGIPTGAVDVPAQVRTIAADRPVRCVWENSAGGRTFEVDGRFVKWTPAASGIDLNAEALRLSWAAGFTPVPHVLEQGSDEAGSWLVTAALAGDSAVSPRWLAEPDTAVRAIGAGLRAFHEALPVEDCPFSWMAEDRLAAIRDRVRRGALDPGRWFEIHRPLGIDGALAVLADMPPLDRRVVCHGDSCVPNTLIGTDGKWSAHVDLGQLGVADRWADLAVATWSTEWNYGPGWESALLDAYGIAPDLNRTRYYRLLWDLGP